MTDDYDLEIERQEEENTDNLTEQGLSNAVVTSTDWTTETIISQMSRGNIKLNPSFQRRDSWSLDRKSRFLESIFLGLPIPQIVLAEERSHRGRFIVLDGKQRLTTLLQYSGSSDGRNNKFKLQGLSLRADLNGVSYSTLSEEPTLSNDLDAFHNQTIRTVVIRNWPSDDFLYLIFIRLNTGSVPLSPQELRQALIPGMFVEFIDDKSCESKSIQKLLGITEPDFRMRDSELLLRHIAFKNYISDYNGSLKAFLDSTCHRLNDKWREMKQKIEQDVVNFNDSIDFCFEIFGESNVGRKWTGDKFQQQFNRAIFDVQSFYFTDDKARNAATNKKTRLLESFKHLCSESKAFQDSVTSTTKSIPSTYNRFRIWGESLKDILGDNVVTSPQLIENRIKFPS